MKTGLSLGKKALIAVTAILLLILGINAAVLTFVASDKYRVAILSKDSAIGEGLQKELGKVLSLGVPVEALEGVNEKLIDISGRDKSIGYAMVTDAAGKVLFHSDAAKVGSVPSDGVSRRTLSADKPLTQAAGSFYDLSFPLLTAEGKIAGVLRVGVKSEAINSQLYELLLWSVGISLVCFLLALAFVYFSISRFIVKPITAMEKAAERISSGELTYAVRVEGKDEIASLGSAINRMAFNLKDIVSKIVGITNTVSTVTSNIASSSQGVQAVADAQQRAVGETASAIEDMDNSISEVAAGAESLSQSAGDTSSAILQMTASIERIAENSNIFSEAAHDTASSVEEMASTIKQIAESLENLSSSAEAIASSIDELNATTRDIERLANDSVRLAEVVTVNASDKGMSAAGAAVEGMENIKSSVLSLSGVINGLGKKTDDIGKILNVIDEVADQTNLLALNAAILASKAGEHGKGFSIVADEIKSLAERTSVSTNEIAALIKSVQDSTKSSIRMASEGVQTVEKGLRLVKDVSTGLGEIVESSKASTGMARSIQRATAEESIVIKQITNAIEGMTHQTENISRAIKEQSKGSKLIIEAAEKVKDLSSQVKTSTEEQKSGSRQIAQVIEIVSQQAAQIAGATNRQKEKSISIVQSMEMIRSTTGKLSTAATEMNSVIGALKEESLNLLSELQKFKV